MIVNLAVNALSLSKALVVNKKDTVPKGVRTDPDPDGNRGPAVPQSKWGYRC
jgi:hypothetical protein